MKKFIMLLLIVLVLSGCGKPKGEEQTFTDAEITDVNDWSADSSYSCEFYIKTDSEVIPVEVDSDFCSSFGEGDRVSGSYIVSDEENLNYLVNIE